MADYGMSRSIMQDKDDKNCFLCYSPGSETHHIFGGPNRTLSDVDGCCVYLCRDCHKGIHDKARGLRYLREQGQRRWMEVYGTKADFIKRYGKSYI